MKNKNKQIYLAGDMLLHSAILKREQEKKTLEDIGYEVYAPHDDKEINDKSNQTEESNNNLAERIVENDTIGIVESDIVVIEPLPHAQGTLVELGQIKGMRDVARWMLWQNRCDDQVISDPQVKLNHILSICEDVLNQKIYAHYGDIRRTDIPEKGDRRSWSVNQYVYGTVLNVTQGRGFQEFDEIVEELKGE